MAEEVLDVKKKKGYNVNRYDKSYRFFYRSSLQCW